VSDIPAVAKVGCGFRGDCRYLLAKDHRHLTIGYGQVSAMPTLNLHSPPRLGDPFAHLKVKDFQPDELRQNP
jgi:hypothetical protein